MLCLFICLLWDRYPSHRRRHSRDSLDPIVDFRFVGRCCFFGRIAIVVSAVTAVVVDCVGNASRISDGSTRFVGSQSTKERNIVPSVSMTNVAPASERFCPIGKDEDGLPGSQQRDGGSAWAIPKASATRASGSYNNGNLAPVAAAVFCVDLKDSSAMAINRVVIVSSPCWLRTKIG